MKTKEYQTEMVSIVKKLGAVHGVREVWDDYLTMFSCALSNPFDKRFYEERESIYLDCVKKYNQEELSQFPTLAVLTALALEDNPEQDFLGTVYTDMGLYSKYNQQYFTPYHIADTMAKMVLNDLEESSKGKPFISVSDPSCGSGRMLIALANTAKQKGLHFQNQILYVAQDIDRTVALMCYIQLSLLGCAGIIKIGNSLTEPITNSDMQSDRLWFTPYCFSNVWIINRWLVAKSGINPPSGADNTNTGGGLSEEKSAS